MLMLVDPLFLHWLSEYAKIILYYHLNAFSTKYEQKLCPLIFQWKRWHRVAV